MARSKKSKQEAKDKLLKELSEADNDKNSSKKSKDKVKAFFVGERILTEATDSARNLYGQSRYGAVTDTGEIQLTLCEGLYLLEKKKIILMDGKNKPFDTKRFMRKAVKLEPNFWVRYCVFQDFRNRGYIIKTALKFGADFRIYDRGVKPGEDHAKWIVFPVREADALTWYEFSSKNRVAHSTKKRLLIGCVDEEGDCTYWEVKWTRP